MGANQGKNAAASANKKQNHNRSHSRSIFGGGILAHDVNVSANAKALVDRTKFRVSQDDFDFEDIPSFMVHQISHFLKYDQEELSKVFSSYCTTTSKHGLTDAEFSAVAEMLKKKSKVSGNEDTTFLTSDSAETLLQTFLNRIISVGPGFVKDILHIIHGKFKDKGKQLQQKVDAIRKNRRNEYSHMTEEQKQEKTEEFEKYKRNMKRLIDLESKVNTHITATFKSLDNDMSKNYMCQTIFLSMDTHRSAVLSEREFTRNWHSAIKKALGRELQIDFLFPSGMEQW